MTDRQAPHLSPATTNEITTISSKMANFIPELWSGKLVASFYDATVLAAIANTDYEGEIKSKGDTVHIRTRPGVSINDYNPALGLAIDVPVSGKVELKIDRAKYFNALCDDVYAIQNDINMMTEWTTEASEQMKIVVDRDVLSTVVTSLATDANAADFSGKVAGQSGSYNLGEIATSGGAIASQSKSKALDVKKDDVIDLLVDMGSVMDENNVPETGRYVVLPAWVANRIKKSELAGANFSGDGTSMKRNGRVGMIDRFTVYTSNLMPVTPSSEGTPVNMSYILAGHKTGLTFASQLVNMDTIKSERTFGKLVRALQVYGHQVIKPESFALACVKPG